MTRQREINFEERFDYSDKNSEIFQLFFLSLHFLPLTLSLSLPRSPSFSPFLSVLHSISLYINICIFLSRSMSLPSLLSMSIPLSHTHSLFLSLPLSFSLSIRLSINLSIYVNLFLSLNIFLYLYLCLLIYRSRALFSYF